MLLTLVVVAVIALTAVAVAAFYISESRAHARFIERQDQLLAIETERVTALLDRLVMKQGFTPLSETGKVRQDSAPIQSMELSDPFQAAEQNWEQEDVERARTILSLIDDDERNDIAEAARQRASNN